MRPAVPRFAPAIPLVATLAVTFVASGASAGSLRDGVPATTDPPVSVASWDFEPDAVESSAAPISPTRAVLYSLVLPGLGDYALGNRGRASAFFIAEGAIWISYAVFQVQGHGREDEYQALAARFAGVTGSGHSDEFYATLREFDASDEYEAEVKNEGRFAIGDPARIGPDAIEQYFVENRVSDYEPWVWESTERRLQYSEMRSASKTSYRRADYMFAAAAANRLASAIVAYAAARSANKAYTVGYLIDVTPSSAGGLDVAVVLTRSF